MPRRQAMTRGQELDDALASARLAGGQGRDLTSGRDPGASSQAQAVLTLQRQAGNRAVSSLLSGGTMTIQRDDDLEGLDAASRGGALMDVGANLSGQITSGYNLPGFSDPNYATPQATGGGVSTPVLGTVTGGIGIAFSSKQHHEARKALSTATPGTVGHKAAKRDYVGSATNVAQSTYGTASNITSTVAGSMTAAGSSGAQMAGAIAAPLTVPLNVLQAVRWGRKAHGARLRCDALKALIASEDAKIDPKTRLKALDDKVTALEDQKQEYIEARVEAAKEVTALEKSLKQFQLLRRPTRTQRMQMAELEMRVEAAKELVKNVEKDIDATATDLQAATQERNLVKKAREEMEKAVTEEAAIVVSGKTEQISLRMIQAYALKKNQRGLVKKIVNTIGSIIGAGAGVAGTVAAIAIAAGATAGASVLMATPVGWALGGAAALIGLGMASYSAWKFFSKRWKRTGSMTDASGQKLGFGARLGKTLAFWQKTGPSRRELYADKLYELAKDDAGPNKAKADEARATITSLGLDWVGSNMAADKPNSVKLIALKMGS